MTVCLHPYEVSGAIAERLFPGPEPIPIVVKPYLSSDIPGVETEQGVTDYLRDHQYVSNYNVSILVVRVSDHVEPGRQFKFHLSIEDDGINRLSENKFFWMVVFNPQGRLAAVYPSSDRSPILPQTKWERPRDMRPYAYDVLFKGNQDGHEIEYVFSIPNDPSSIGTWKTYVLVFDETYFDRWGKALECKSTGGCGCCPPDKDNTVGYTVVSFDVLERSPPTAASPADAFPWIVIVASFVLAYFTYSKRTQEIDATFGKLFSAMKKHWLFILVLLVLVSCMLLQLVDMKCVPIPIP